VSLATKAIVKEGVIESAAMHGSRVCYGDGYLFTSTPKKLIAYDILRGTFFDGLKLVDPEC
jgi:hypothetical protein